MYDCENDVLLGSPALDLFDKGNVFVSTIMVLWLVLNYKLFCIGLIDKTEWYKSNIHNLLGKENLERYKAEVSMPFHSKISKTKTFDPSNFKPVNPKRKLESYPECS